MLATGHEFWLQPAKFTYALGETAAIYFKVGENFLGAAWKGDADRVQRLEHHGPAGKTTLRPTMDSAAAAPIRVTLRDEGTHIFIMQTNEAFIALGGKDFTTYLEEDGLDEVLHQRSKDGTSQDSATELYSRHAKLILNCGSTQDDNYRKVFDLPIEIVPQQNPSSLRKGDPVSFLILFQGKPLFGAKVKVWNRYRNRTSVQNIFSQQDGIIETHISNPGDWMVSVVKMIPSVDSKAQYQSYWGTLVFGVKP